MTMPQRAMGILGAAALMVAAIGMGSASATTTQSPWHRYHQPDFVVPAGEGCAFRVAAHVLYDREFFRTISHYSDGSPRVQLFRGPLIIQYVNVHTGKKVVRNQAGVATEKFTRSGDFASIKLMSGHFGATLHEGTEPGRGVYYVGGQGTSLVVNADGSVSLHLGTKGTAQNLCPILHG